MAVLAAPLRTTCLPSLVGVLRTFSFGYCSGRQTGARPLSELNAECPEPRVDGTYASGRNQARSGDGLPPIWRTGASHTPYRHLKNQDFEACCVRTAECAVSPIITPEPGFTLTRGKWRDHVTPNQATLQRPKGAASAYAWRRRRTLQPPRGAAWEPTYSVGIGRASAETQAWPGRVGLGFWRGVEAVRPWRGGVFRAARDFHHFDHRRAPTSSTTTTATKSRRPLERERRAQFSKIVRPGGRPAPLCPLRRRRSLILRRELGMAEQLLSTQTQKTSTFE